MIFQMVNFIFLFWYTLYPALVQSIIKISIPLIPIFGTHKNKMAGDTEAEFGVLLSAGFAADELNSLDENLKKKLEGVLDEKERAADCVKSQLERERVNFGGYYF